MRLGALFYIIETVSCDWFYENGLLRMCGSPVNVQTYIIATMTRPYEYWLTVRYRNIDRLPDADHTEKHAGWQTDM